METNTMTTDQAAILRATRENRQHVEGQETRAWDAIQAIRDAIAAIDAARHAVAATDYTWSKHGPPATLESAAEVAGSALFDLVRMVARRKFTGPDTALDNF
jgi:hypothetical protein